MQKEKDMYIIIYSKYYLFRVTESEDNNSGKKDVFSIMKVGIMGFMTKTADLSKKVNDDENQNNILGRTRNKRLWILRFNEESWGSN